MIRKFYRRLRLRMRLLSLEHRIKHYPYWGAALTAMDEERRAIRRQLEEPTR